MDTIEAWETEDPLLIVFGTHDVAVAYAVASAWYEANSEVPEGLEELLCEDSIREWVDPAVMDIEEESWPDHMMSLVEVEGWTPCMVVSY